jgi:hypothetical protein
MISNGCMRFAFVFLLLIMALPWCRCLAAEQQTNLTQGLIHYWSFDRADHFNGMRDSAGDIPLNAQRRSGEWMVKGVAGEAADIAADVLLDSGVHEIASSSMTVAGWIRIQSLDRAPKTRAILSLGSHYSPLEKPWVFQLTEQKLVFASGAKSVKSAEALPEGRWIHVAAAVSAPEGASDATARTVHLYVDGRQVATGPININPKAAMLVVGNTHRGGPDFLGGQIDELAIWDRAVSASDVAALHQLGCSGKAISSLVSASLQTISIQAVKASNGGGGTFVLRRDSDQGTLRVHVKSTGLGIAGTDYVPIATTQMIPAGSREIHIPVARIEDSPIISRDDVKATIEPSILYTINQAQATARVWLSADWPTPAPARPKKIYAHYMGCYPVAAAATAYHRDADAHKIRHDGKGRFERSGDRWRNWPLVPDGMMLNLEQSADLEIRRALRGGIDGFAVDAWAGGQSAKDVFSALLKVARDKDYPFEVTICLDPAVLDKDGMRDTLRWIMKEHGQNPKLARRDGKPLIFGYMSGNVGRQHGAQALRQKPDFTDKDYRTLALNRDLRKTKTGWQLMAQGHQEIENAAGTPLFFHYCMGDFFGGVGGTHEEKLQAAAFMAGQFGAVGEFKAFGPLYDQMADVVLAAGAEWSQPMYYQYENLHFPGNDHISNGSEVLRGVWEAARRNQSTLIQFVTWNDYTENTHLAPGYETRYAVLDLNRYFIDWWKSGREPKPEKDKIYLFFRKYPADARIYPFERLQKDPAGVIEVLTLLTKPGQVQLPGRGDAWEAPAGMSWRHFPVTPGPLRVELSRPKSSGLQEVVLSLNSPEPITDKPFRQMKSMAAICTEFEQHWRADFGNAPMVLRGEYADDDNDGLPNWFEMYWFGKFLDWTTATKADPNTIGADGKTLLQHYCDQTDPMRPAVTGPMQTP